MEKGSAVMVCEHPVTVGVGDLVVDPDEGSPVRPLQPVPESSSADRTIGLRVHVRRRVQASAQPEAVATPTEALSRCSPRPPR
jgi:hypothetical protein